MAEGSARPRIPLTRWFSVAKTSAQLWRALRFLRDPAVLEAAVTASAQVVAEMRPLTRDVSRARHLADLLMHDMSEVSRRCTMRQTYVQRLGWLPWRTPNTLELSIAWHQLAQVSAFIAGRDVRYGRDLHESDPHLPVFVIGRPVPDGTAPPGLGALHTGQRYHLTPGRTQASAALGVQAPGTVPLLAPKTARQMARDVTNVLHATARCAEACIKQLPPDKSITPFRVGAVVASFHALAEWLNEQVERMRDTYHIGASLHHTLTPRAPSDTASAP